MKNWILKKLNLKNRNTMCKTIEITVDNAKLAYQKGNKETRETLENLLGAEHFKAYKNWQDIKSFETACEVAGIDPVKFVKNLEDNGDTVDEIAYKKLKLIIRTINGDWKPDWNNQNQKKWYPWFNTQSGFSYALTDCDVAATSLGSSLVVDSSDKAVHMATHFLNEYKSFLI